MRTKTFSYYLGSGICWIRFLGRGIAMKDKTKHLPLFSERNGYKKVLRLGKWGVEWLGRNSIFYPGFGVVTRVTDPERIKRLDEIARMGRT